MNPNSHLYIDHDTDLATLCHDLSAIKWLALDTEFIRERTYYPQLCLIQIATEEQIAIIDPLTINDLSPLYELLYAPNIVKIVHACHQDLEIFFHLTDQVPGPIFDTQIAAPLLGLTPQSAYATLVHELLGIQLNKAHARADWKKRPLPDDWLQYAADDVRYLGPLHQLMVKQLTERNRLDWLNNDFTALSDKDRYDNSPDKAWQRIKGGRRLRGAALAALQTLAAWREHEAQQRDMPRNWLLRDEAMIDIARRRPRDIDALAGIRGIHHDFIQQQGQTILAALAQMPATTVEPPLAIRPERLSSEQLALVEVLQAAVCICALKHDIHPSVITSRKELERFVVGERELAFLSGWRQYLAGDILMEVLAGRQVLQIENGQAQLVASQ